MMPNPKLFGIVIGVVGVVILIIGGYVASQQMAFLDRCLETKAVVVDLHWEEEYVSDQENSYFTLIGWPIFQFVDVRTGEQITAQGSFGSSDPPFSVGQEVDILYDPENPSGLVTVKSFWDIWLLPIMLFFIAAIFVSVGIVVIVRS
ncbi:DUF3592 domain-containing protein [Candidatus Bathyarchaeota archaeon]|nr:DUF3592 domain-containing protein [Candidatus Bathyarchaeota archaeon]